MLRNRAIVMTLIFVSGMLAASSVRGQEFPGLGVGDIYQANMQFERQFDQWARVGAWQAALATPNDQPLPFNAMTISNSVSAGNDATLGYIRASQYNSNRACGAVERWDTGAVQGNWYYGSQYGGPAQVLPYVPNSYYEQNGYLYGGYQQGGNNYYPMYYGR
jgi:hypothetical protein